jgi:diguanylate cyclase (GGDEF)-like protein
VETVNGAFGALAGSDDADELVGTAWLELLAPTVRARAVEALDEMLREGRSELTARINGTPERFLELFLVRRLDPFGCYAGFHLFVRDVTQRIRSEAETAELAASLADANRRLERQAHIDPLTGLLNRRGLERHIAKLQTRARRRATRTAVILVDIDDFKQINDRHGHTGGDRVLEEVAQALERLARASDFVARIGGDEFLLVLPDTRLGEATLIAERMRSAIADEAVELGEGHAQVTASFGVSTLPEGDTTIARLVEAVSLELTNSKSGGKNHVCAGGEVDQDTPLGEILAGEGLRAVHQPIHDLLENRVVAYEMLARGPNGRYELPEVFLGFLHAGEGATRLDLACLRACVDAARRLPPDTCVHVNLFPSTLTDAGAERVLSELERGGTERRFCVELNERDLPGDSPELAAEVRALKAAGVQVAIDDVGFGNTSLEALVRLDPDVIKIDRACVSAEDDGCGLERLLSVANVLGARVIAAGIEDEPTLERRRALRVRYGQGYLWGRPQPTDSGVLWPRAGARRVERGGPARDRERSSA